MYPNPSENIISFDKSLEVVEIFDITGKKLYTFNINKLVWQTKINSKVGIKKTIKAFKKEKLERLNML